MQVAVAGSFANEFLTGTTEFDPGASPPLHSHDREESVATGVCRAVGMPAADADLMADSLAMADLWGTSCTA